MKVEDDGQHDGWSIEIGMIEDSARRVGSRPSTYLYFIFKPSPMDIQPCPDDR